MPQPRRSRSTPPMLPRGVRIVHEDDAILVLDKPAGLLSALVGDGSHREDEPNLFSLVKEHLRGHRKGSARVAWIVHRLDKDVSGLIVFARTEQAFNWLKEDLRQRRVHRTYVAVVEGVVGAEVARHAEEGVDVVARRGVAGAIEGSIRSRLEERGDGRMGSVPAHATAPRGARAAADEDAPDAAAGDDDIEAGRGKLAVTHFRVLAQSAQRGVSLLAIRLDTGRRNQIRIHCREMGHAIVGDRRYGAADDPLRQVCLHAASLCFRHPVTGAVMRFSSPPPEALARLAGLDADGVMTRLERGAEEGGATGPGWDHVADWYDEMVGGRRDDQGAIDRRGGRDFGQRRGRRGDTPPDSAGRLRRDEGSDHYEQVILPGALHLLEPRQGMRVLDLACGQGVFARRLSALGVSTLGLDASARLVEMAREASRGDPRQHFEVADVRALDVAALGPGSFDAVTCVMALMNIEPLEPMLRSAAALLRPGGRFVAVLLHPAFRAPGQTSWGWTGDAGATRPGPPPQREDRRDMESARPRERPGTGSGRGTAKGSGRDTPAVKSEQRGADDVRQFRRVDAYLSPAQRDILMNPGAAAEGRQAVNTTTYHRPIQTYVRLLVAAGLLIDALEEWPSQRRSEPGPGAAEENRVRREIPMFMGVRARAGERAGAGRG